MTQPKRAEGSRRPPTIPYAGSGAPMTAGIANAPAAPAPPPREITAAVRRRSWGDPIIRFWILASVALVAIGVWFTTQQIMESRAEQWLIANGKEIDDAVVQDSGGDDLHVIPVGASVTLKFDWQGQETVVVGYLTTQTKGIQPGTNLKDLQPPIRLRVDPGDASNWTDRESPEPLIRRLIAGAVIIPVVVATIGAACLLRRRLLGIWRDSDAALFNVVESKYSALAPLSHTVRCVSALGRKSEIVTVYLPARIARPKAGDLIWLLHRRGKAKPAIAAAVFE